MATDATLAAAQRKLDAAVEEYLTATGWSKSGVLTAWVLVGHQHGVGDDGDITTCVPIVYMNGTQPDHVALGLLQIAADTIRGVGRWSRDNEDG